MEEELEFVSDAKQPSEVVPELVRRRLWEAVEGGWLVHDFHDYNPWVARITAEREQKTERQRRWREKKRTPSGTFGVDAAVDASPEVGRDASSDAAPVPTRPGPSPTTSPSPARRESARSRGSRPEEVFEAEAFARFWAAYPRKQGKGAAESAWNKAILQGTPTRDILDGVQRYALERRGQDAQYTKHPSTWLNGRCWEDEPDPVYIPPVIGAPSEAAAAYPPPFSAFKAELEAHRTGRDQHPDDKFGNLFGIPE